MSYQLAKFDKEKFLKLIRSGYTEPRALAEINFEVALYPLYLIRYPEFKEDVVEAKKARADVFFEKIVDSIDDVLEKDEVPAAKLRLDTLKYVAAIDNPEKYSEKVKHQHDINVNIFQEIKDLPASEMKRLLATADPFAVEAEFSEVEDDTEGL